MAKYRVTAKANSGAFVDFTEYIKEMDLIEQDGDNEVYEITTNMDIENKLNQSHGVVDYSEHCELCGGFFGCDYMETDTGSVCSKCQSEAEGYDG